MRHLRYSKHRALAVALCLLAALLAFHRAAAQTVQIPVLPNQIETSTWSGFIIVDENDLLANSQVSATIVVPQITRDELANCVKHPNVNSGVQTISIWVGIDGFTPNGKGSDRLLQAGVNGTVFCDVKNFVKYDSFVELLPAAAKPCRDPITKQPLSVQAGNHIVVTVNGRGVVMDNLDTNESCNVLVGKKLIPIGNSAEWIVERRCIENVLTTLADYGNGITIFSNASVLYQNSDTSGSYTAILSPGGYAYSTANGLVSPPITGPWYQLTMYEPLKAGGRENLSAATAPPLPVMVGSNPLTYDFSFQHDPVFQKNPTDCKHVNP